MARSQSDLPVAAPRRRTAKPKAKRAPPRRVLPAFLLAHPGRTAACAVVAAVLTGIVLNAAFFQNGRHPAPLFANSPTYVPRSAIPDVPVPSPRPSDRALLPPSASAPAATTAQPAASATTMTSPPLPVPVPRATPARVEPPEARRDLIGALIRTEVPSDFSERVAAAQRALVKVGYVLRSDGHMGTGTRKAVEQFQRERNLTVTGDLDGRTVRELQAQSRVTIP